MKTITARVTDTKRHTVGFVLNNNSRVTRGEAVRLARKGLLRNVVARRGRDCQYVTTLPNSKRTLSDLPVVVR